MNRVEQKIIEELETALFDLYECRGKGNEICMIKAERFYYYRQFAEKVLGRRIKIKDWKIEKEK